MLASIHHILPLTTITRERILPTAGTVLVRLSQKVSSSDIIAETTWAREHVLLDIASMLNLSIKEADKLLKCKVGDLIASGQEVAIGSGLFPRTVRAPREGRVVAAGGGKVLLEVGESKVELRAGIPGMVVQLIPERGAVIQTAGALIQGVWGNGRIDSGLLINLAEKPDSILTSARLDVSLRGSIIMGGICKDAETLQVAAELPARGLILSSLFPSLLPLAREMRYPILITDGFGTLPMNSAAHRLLSSSAKRDATLNAEVYDRYSGARPEVIIPLPISQSPAPPVDLLMFEAGQQVRLLRPPATGVIGTLVSIRPGMTVLPSGLRASSADVKLESGETIIVPLVNIEVVG
jgi:hypothetical protein